MTPIASRPGGDRGGRRALEGLAASTTGAARRDRAGPRARASGADVAWIVARIAGGETTSADDETTAVATRAYIGESAAANSLLQTPADKCEPLSEAGDGVSGCVNLLAQVAERAEGREDPDLRGPDRRLSLLVLARSRDGDRACPEGECSLLVW